MKERHHRPLVLIDIPRNSRTPALSSTHSPPAPLLTDPATVDGAGVGAKTTPPGSPPPHAMRALRRIHGGAPPAGRQCAHSIDGRTRPPRLRRLAPRPTRRHAAGKGAARGTVATPPTRKRRIHPNEGHGGIGGGWPTDDATAAGSHWDPPLTNAARPHVSADRDHAPPHGWWRGRSPPPVPAMPH